MITQADSVTLQAYRTGLYGPNIVWIFMGFYASEFWKTNPTQTDCTDEELGQAVEGSFLIKNIQVNPNEKRGIANLTCKFTNRIH